MVRIFLLALLVSVSLGLTACNETSVPPPEPLKLEGTAWKLVYFVDVENNTKREPEYHPVEVTGGHIIDHKPHPKDFTLAFGIDTFYVPDTSYPHMTHGRKLTGLAVINYLMKSDYDSNFSIDYNSNILTTGSMSATAVGGETKDANLYLNILCGKNQSFPFELSADTLKLFYNDKKNCLIYRRFYEN